MKWLILILGILCNAGASVLVKVAMQPPRKFPSLDDLAGTLYNWPFWLGLFLYGATFLFYAAALSRFPLNVAQPTLTAGAIAMVSVISFFFFREPFHWTTGVGVVLVIIGVVMITMRVG